MPQLLVRIGITLSILVLSACGRPPPQSWSDAAPWGDTATQDLTLPIALIADTQIHESRGTASRYFSLAGDQFVEVTIRSGQQVLGAGDILQEALRKSRDYRLALHLGDAIDVSCSTEWQRFSLVMARERGAPGPSTWLFAPGNHDGYLVGNFYPLDRGVYTDSYWNNICNVGRVIQNDHYVHERITKPRVLQDYLNKLFGDKKQLDQSTQSRICPLKGLCLSYSLSIEGWTSYLIQLVELPAAPTAKRPIYALLLDTSDYDVRPYLPGSNPKAGLEAGVSQRQLQSALELLGEVGQDARFFIAGHHPVETWRINGSPPTNGNAWAALLADPRFLRFFVTAHTHEGGWYKHQIEGITLNELNLGSLADAPAYFRSLQFQENAEGSIRANSERVILANEASPDCTQFSAKAGSGYAVSEQMSQAQRWSDYPWYLSRGLAAISATRYSFALWSAKHEELRPQLRFYADIVDSTMPAEQIISYEAFGTPASTRVLAGKQQVVERLIHLSDCNDGKACSVQEKGHLMLAMDDYYWDESTPKPVREAAHIQRYCVALKSTEELGSGQKVVAKVLENSAPQFRTLQYGRDIPAR